MKKYTTANILGVPIAITNMNDAIDRVAGWIQNGERGKIVTFSTVHMLVEATKSKGFLKLLNQADMNCPDGKPLVWLGRMKSGMSTSQVCGPEFLPSFCSRTANSGYRHFFYGGAPGVAESAAKRLKEQYPALEIAGIYSPPFRRLTAEEDEEIVSSINAARPDLIWVCLGCPKQEMWISEHKDRLNASVLLAIGLALDVAAGRTKRAPAIFRNAGMEWFYRLCQEPRRLWKRYLVYNSVFAYHILLELLGGAHHSHQSSNT